MTVVVTENCNGCRFTECVTVCPVACFHGDGEMLYIDPNECIECRACVTACPVRAIYDTEDLPHALLPWIEINRARAAVLPPVTDRATPLSGAEDRRRALGH